MTFHGLGIELPYAAILGGAGTSGPPAFVPLSGSAFDMNFATGQYFGATTANLSCTRAQTVTSYVENADGTVTACAANSLRIGTGKGLLIEDTSTNVMLNSEDLTVAPWATSVTGSGAVTTTANAGLAPNGTNTATLVTVNRSVGTDQAQRYQSFTGSGASWSCGIFIQAATAADIGKSISINFFNGTVSTNVLVPLTGLIQRIPVAATMSISSNCNMAIGYTNGDNASTGPVSFYAWGAQVELGGGLTSYIPTTSATQARAADVITASGPILTAYQSSAVTQFSRFICSKAVNGARLGASWDSHATPAYLPAGAQVNIYSGAASLTSIAIGNGVSSTLQGGGYVNAVGSFSAGSASIVANGGAERTGALTFAAATTVSIGSDAGAATTFLNGYLGRLAAWTSQLASATRVALSNTFTTTSLTISGDNTNYLVPANIPLSGIFVSLFHGAGDIETAWTADAVQLTNREALLAKGHILACSAAAGDNWGNSAGNAAFVAQWADAQSRFSVSKYIAIGQSMGGLCSLLSMAANSLPIKGWYGIYPVCNLAKEYSLSFTAAINTAYNIPGGGTYAAQTAGHDPVLLSGSQFTLPMRFIASQQDTTVPETDNSLQMQTLVAATTPEHVVLSARGVHGDLSHIIPQDLVAFIARC